MTFLGSSFWWSVMNKTYGRIDNCHVKTNANEKSQFFMIFIWILNDFIVYEE